MVWFYYLFGVAFLAIDLEVGVKIVDHPEGEFWSVVANTHSRLHS